MQRPGPFPRHRVFAIVGIAFPFLLALLTAWNSPPSFDGGMNIQVAQSLAEGSGYTRPYAEGTLFPPEIQTSGSFLFLEAAAIAIFGQRTAVYQFANLFFVLTLAVAVSMAVRRWLLARLVGPSVAIIGVPLALEWALDGFGEYPVAALALLAFGWLSRGFSSATRRPYLWIACAAAAAGVAFTVKTVALLIVPVLAVGAAGGLAAQRRVRWRRTVLALAVGALPPAAFELYRLISFGSARAYAAYWRYQVPQIVSQAGFQIEGALDLDRAARQAGRSVFAKIAEHWSVLARDVGMNGVELTVVVVAPFAALVWLAVLHRSTWRTWLVDRQGLLAVQVALYCGGYLVWWLAITPTDKAWYRRIVIGLVALAFLYVLIVGSVTDAVRPALRPPRRWRTSESLLGGFTACAVATAGFAVAPAAADTVTEAFANAPWRANSPAAAREREVREVAREVDRISAEGGKVYAIGWWSVPVVQVYAESPIRNLFGLLREGWDDFCQPTAGLVTGEAYILWDTASARELGFDPREVIDNVTFDPTPRLANGEATILAVSVDPQFCSDILGK